ncbi:MAG: HAD-IA family hydrolase [Pseudomonadota bacterium]
MSTRPDLQKLLSDPSIAAISFDIFDTAIVRPFLEPKDLFYFIARKARIISGLTNFQFAEVRITAESRIRQQLNQQHKYRDPGLAEIYQEVSRSHLLNAQTIQELMRLEVETEIKLAQSNSSLLKVYWEALNADKRVIFISDTYLDTSTIRRMLNRCGYNKFEHLFISSAEGATKKHGGLFDIAASTLSVQPSQILHIGDNRHSDIKMGRRRGVTTYYLQSPRERYLAHHSTISIWGNTRALDDVTRAFQAIYANRYHQELLDLYRRPEGESSTTLEQTGYYALGPFLYSMLTEIDLVANRMSIDSLHFLARDGFLPLQAWQIMFPEHETSIKASYLHISRRAVAPYQIVNGDIITTLLSGQVDEEYSVERLFFTRLGSEQGAELKAIYESTVGPATTPVSEKLVELRQFLISNREFIMHRLRPIAKATEDYFSTAFADATRPAIFDVGRKGTYQSFLSFLLNRDVFGFYVMTEGSITANMRSDEYHALFPQVTRSVFRDEPDTVIFESLLSDPGPSIQGWNGDCEMLFAHDTSLDDHSKRRVELVQKGALNFVRDVEETFGPALREVRHKPRIALHPLNCVLASTFGRNVFQDIRHEDGFSLKTRRDVASYHRGPAPAVLSDQSAAEDAVDHRSQALVSSANRRRIAIYCPRMSAVRGGAERVTSILATYFSAHGFDPVVLSSGDLNDRTPTPVYPLPANCPVIHVDTAENQNLRQSLEAINPSCLLVLASGLAVRNFPKACRQLGIPLLLSERADPAASIEAYWHSNNAKYFRTYRRADLIALQLPSFAAHFPFYLKPKIIVLPNPVIPPHLLGTTDVDVDGPQRKNIILNVARYALAQKRQDLLIRAFKRIAEEAPNWELHLYGDDVHGNKAALEKLTAELGLTARVRLNNSTNNIFEIYANSKVFAFPSKFEGFPNALAEALISGLPAVGSGTCPGVNDLIHDRKNGILVYENGNCDVAPWSKALLELIHNQKRRQKMGSQAKIFMDDYHYENCLSQWHQAVNALIRLRTRNFSQHGPFARWIRTKTTKHETKLTL